MCDVETYKNTIMLIVYSCTRMENTFLAENDDVTSMKFECHLYANNTHNEVYFLSESL
jgi:hypothetical protein